MSSRSLHTSSAVRWMKMEECSASGPTVMALMPTSSKTKSSGGAMPRMRAQRARRRSTSGNCLAVTRTAWPSISAMTTSRTTSRNFPQSQSAPGTARKASMAWRSASYS